jgi:hypothetical protein
MGLPSPLPRLNTQPLDDSVETEGITCPRCVAVEVINNADSFSSHILASRLNLCTGLYVRRISSLPVWFLYNHK